MRPQRWDGVRASVGSMLLLTGCSTLGPDTASAAQAAEAFHRAVSVKDGAAACALLAPGTVHELEQSAKAACAGALLDEDVPEAAGVVRVHVDGREAQVVLKGDVVFLTVDSGQWRVQAAGCTPQPPAPYECTVEGG